jgi:hypothetical protein
VDEPLVATDEESLSEASPSMSHAPTTRDPAAPVPVTRRRVLADASSLAAATAAAAATALASALNPRGAQAVDKPSTHDAKTPPQHRPRFARRGIILCRRDLDQPDWPELMADAGLNTMAVHLMTMAEFVDYAKSAKGAETLDRFRRRGVSVEFEHHIMNELLPRALFDDAPDMFRMDEKGARTPKANLCPSSDAALKTIRSNAERLARLQPHRTGRYFFWPDDAAAWCSCPACRDLTASDQNLILANTILEGVRRFDPQATACCLAYAQTLPAPRSVKPADGIFLEFAPIHRSWQHPLNDPNCKENRRHVAWMEGLLKVFGTKGAQVLEYWLDASRHSNWKRPSKRLPDMSPCLEPDMAFYAASGFESVTTFGVYLDPDYWRMYGPPPIKEYARAARGPAT